MCSVIGSILIEPSFSELSILRNVFYQSAIRGLHATGISYLKSGKVITKKSPLSFDRFDLNFSEILDSEKNITLIGHCRYSTSDLLYNQPIDGSDIAIAHNGVISQEPPELWEKLYGYKCRTKNDSELILQSVFHGKSPLLEWKNSSISCCELSSGGGLRFYRNGKRPLYYCTIKRGIIVASTMDILKRSGISENIKMAKINTYYSVGKDLEIKELTEDISSKDLQMPNENT